MRSKKWLWAAIFTFITICAWVIFDVIHTRNSVEVPAPTKEVIEPIDPNFNIKSLQQTP